ncbi:MAG: hypothetical protein ACM3S4_05065 [Burkholderiales bacterium]
MDSVKSIMHLCMNNIRRWAANPRFYVIAVLGAIWIQYLVGPILTFSQAVNVKVTPWAFPFTLVNWYPAMVIMLGVVLLFCDAPFMNNSTPYECIRSGKKHWVVGQLLYVVAASIIFVLFLVLVSIICLVPNIDFSNEWGKVYNTLAQTSAGIEYVQIPISYSIILNYTPLNALLISSLILFLETLFVGLVMFTLNMITNRIGGVFAGLLLAFMPAFANVVVIPEFYYFAPTAWANLDMIDVTGRSLYPSIAYALCFLLISIVLLTVTILRIYKKREIEVLMPV